jgi:hypothetical protein
MTARCGLRKNTDKRRVVRIEGVAREHDGIDERHAELDDSARSGRSGL